MTPYKTVQLGHHDGVVDKIPTKRSLFYTACPGDWPFRPENVAPGTDLTLLKPGAPIEFDLVEARYRTKTSRYAINVRYRSRSCPELGERA